ncbi:GDSL esterase/lipase 7 [Morella rubra]|uniref:GDSL esterase/lipase 7 n=1 Tax=Morella rubra TaxID=262757 RepID=A0A6A1VK23_9ROSI|nr:GDSL esterase/lipase 7 [Morella rubra]
MGPTLLFISLSIFLRLLSVSCHRRPLAPALYVFGDSMFDSGNNNILPTIAKADFPPYGVNFAKGVTGRFTNGKTIADFIAEFLRLPYAPPVISIPESTSLTGLNYASGSCGLLPETGNRFIDLFEITVESALPSHFDTSCELSEHLSESIFLLSVGSNDYINNYLDDTYDTIKRYPPKRFAKLLIDALSHRFKRLYNLGARKTVMFEIGPVGCIPSMTRKHEHNGRCVEDINQIVSFFNRRLPSLLKNLTSSLRGSTFVLGKANSLGHDAITHPCKYGLEDSTNPCCTTWGNGTSECIPLLEPCRHPNKYFFWDAFHLTETVCSVVATRCFNDTSLCSPNIKQLVRIKN